MEIVDGREGRIGIALYYYRRACMGLEEGGWTEALEATRDEQWAVNEAVVGYVDGNVELADMLGAIYDWEKACESKARS